MDYFFVPTLLVNYLSTLVKARLVEKLFVVEDSMLSSLGNSRKFIIFKDFCDGTFMNLRYFH